jgi:hypothetical protein
MKIEIKKDRKEPKLKIKNFTIFSYLLVILIFFVLGIWSERYDARLFLQKSLKEFLEFSSTKIFSNFNKIDKITIDIKYKNYQKIIKSREKAIEYGRLKDEFTEWVPAKIQFNDKETDVRVKLKGTHDDHWAHPYKWSFKIKTKNSDENIYGLKRFAVQHPATISYLYEWLFHVVLKEENLIAHKVKFINLVVNGNDLGVYILIEQISKELIEKNKRREGPIIGFDKELWIEEVKNVDNLGINDIHQFFWTAKIKPSRFKTSLRNTIQETYLNKAINLLEGFRKKELKANEVFDLEQLAKLMAIKAVFASLDFDWKDLKFYYNPITELLEPVSREVHSMHHDHTKLSLWAFNSAPHIFPWHKQFLDLLFDDSVFYETYLAELFRISEKDYLQNIIDKNDKEFKKYLSALKKSYPTVEMFSKTKLAINNKFLVDSLNPVSGINVNFASFNNNTIELNISNLQILPVKVLGIKFNNDKIIFLKDEIYIKGKKYNKPYEKRLIKINCLEFDCSENEIENYEIIYKNLGQTKNRLANVEFWNNSENSKNFQLLKNDYNDLKNYVFFEFKDEKIIIKKGNWSLEDQIIIPKDYKLIVEPGTKLSFTNKGQIVSFSPIFVEGLKEDPIIFKSNFDGNIDKYRKNSENKDYGFGILVIKAQSKSIINNVIFDKLSAPSISSNQSTTGSINFYESDVEITNSKFLDNLRGDDYLNIIRSNFVLSNNTFENTNGDSVDIDFSKGIIKDSIFNKSLNDAVDFSGSIVNLTNIKIIDAGDKAISAGEESEISISNMLISNSKMGLVSKDNSKLFAQNVNIYESDIAISAYLKKSEYGPAFIEAKKITIENSKLKYLKQKNSVISIDENLIPDFNCNQNKEACLTISQ